MAKYSAKITWQRGSQKFTDLKFSRDHEWAFDDGITVKGSSSPLVVPPPMTGPGTIDPEEAFLASLSSCHMLTFLYFAARKGFTVDSYAYGLECVVYMGSEDIKRQSPNVYRMHLLGAKVVPVESGSKTLKDALNEALRDWVTNVENTFYIIGTVAGPAPYPEMVRDFQRVIGDECIEQMPEMAGRQPDAVIACVGGGSNAMGIFYPYIKHEGVRLIGVEAAGLGLTTGKHAASISAGSPGVLHGNRTYLLQDDNGQIIETHSISAGLDYPGVGPEHAYLHDIGRAEYVGITDDEALAAFHHLCRAEGIIPALESSHAMAYAMKLAKTMRPDQHLLVNLSGRGDKDINTVAALQGEKL